MKNKMTPWMIAMLSLSLTVPVFAQAGGGGGGGGGGRGGRGNRGINNNGDPNAGTDFAAAGGNNNFNGNNVNGNNGGGRTGGGRNGNNNLNGNGINGVGINSGRNAVLNGVGNQGGIANLGGGRTRNTFVSTPNAEDYAVLNSMSIFDRNRRVYGPGVEPDTETVVEQVRPRETGPAPAFVGAMKVDTGYVGFLEINGRDGSRVIQIKPGDKIEWDNSSVKSVGLDGIELNRVENPKIPLGYTLENKPAQVAPVISQFQSRDILGGGNYQQNTNAGGRGNRGGGGGFGNQGGGFGNQGGGFGNQGGGFGNQGGGFGNQGGGRQQGGFGNQGGGFGNQGGGFGNQGNFGAQGGQFNQFGGQPAVAPAPVITSDPPVPAGSADTIVERLRQRRLQQTGGQ